ncbi:hypothetical protein FGRMN_8456 [Fusarium graminum]|nr:hypothetical protein FGRMN_8456 [Fusarium graminum]
MSGGHRSVDTSEVEAHQLYGKTNYLEWRRYFDRTAKAHDLWDLLTGTEPVLREPKEEQYVAYFPQTYEAPKTRNNSITSEATSSKKNKEKEKEEELLTIDTQKSLFLWQAAYRRWERQKDKVRMARTLISKSVVSSIAYEVEDISSPHAQVSHIKDTYGVSNEFARSLILEQVASLKLAQCDSMSDYINQHRDLKNDLKRAGQSYSDSQMATNLINGLPKSFGDFVRLWDFHRSQTIGSEPDIHFLIDRLLHEELNQSISKKNKNSSSTNKSPKTDKVCTYKDCGKPGHEEKDCWIAHPEKMPQRIKDKAKTNQSTSKTNGNNTNNNNSTDKGQKPSGIVAMAQGATVFYDSMLPTPDSTSHTLLTDSDSADKQRQIESDHMVLFAADVSDGRNGEMHERECMYLPLNSSVHALAQESATAGRDTILLDSGADICIFNDKKWFSELKSLDISISAVEGSQNVHIQGGGPVTIHLMSTDEIKTPLTILQAAYAPNARYNIISMTYLAKRAGLRGHWDTSRITIEHEGTEVGEARIVGGLYHLQAESTPRQVPTSFVGNINYDNPVWTWHRRLGHLGLQNMINLLDISEGIPLTKQQIRAQLDFICPVCATSKALVRIPRDPATRRQQQPGALIHADVWGPYQIEAMDGTKYWLFFTDDATRFTWGIPFASKTDLPTTFRHLHYLIENGHGFTIRCYRFDGEFYLGPIGTWLDKKHIPFEGTVPYAHYMGGTHERVNRTIREKAAPMIQELTISGQTSKIITEKALETIRDSKIPEAAYSEAIRYSIWLKNRSPTRAWKNKKTPWEALYGRKPIFGRETIWGSRMYITLPPETGRQGKAKLHSPRGWIGYFVGCEAESIFRVFSDQHYRVFRVGVARVQQGEGIEDDHDGLTYNQRTSNPSPVQDYEEHHIEDIEVQPQSPQTRGEPENIDELADDIWIDSDHSSELDTDEQHNTNQDDFDDGASDFFGDEDHNSDDASDGHPISDPHNYNDDVLDSFHDDLELTHITNDTTAFENERLCQESQPDTNTGHTPMSGTNDDADIQGEVVSRFFVNVTEQDDDFVPSSSSSESDINDDTQKIIPKSRQITDWIMEEPCRTCWIRNKPCIWRDRQDTHRCDLCAKLSLKCYVPDYEHPLHLEAKMRYKASMDKNNVETCKRHKRKQDKQRAKKSEILGRIIQKKVSRKGVPKELKCLRCFKRRLACDGQFPCNTCTGGNHLCLKQDQDGLPRCTPCKGKKKKKCDREGPCNECLTRGVDCTYHVQSGLLILLFPVTAKLKAKMEQTASAHCFDCNNSKGTCDGEQPCSNCVHRYLRGRKSLCIYRKDNHLEKYNVSAFTLDDQGRTILKPDWEEHNVASTYRTRAKKSHDSKKRTHISKANHEDNDLDLTNAKIIPTEVGNLECGFFSLINSITAQLPNINPPTITDLRQIFQGTDMRQRNAEALMTNHNNLTVDQIAGILELWGQSQSLNLQLGTMIEGEDPLIVPGQDGSQTIWIHNDNVNSTSPELFNHFSGVTLNQDRHPTEPDTIILPSIDTGELDDDVSFFKNKHVNVAEQNFALEPEPYFYAEAIRGDEASQWKEAMETEKKSHDENGTFEIVDISEIPEGLIPLHSKWAFKRKLDQNGCVARYKARLVAKGYGQREGIDYSETFSSVIKGTSYRVLFAIAALRGWKVWLMDVVTAFLNGHLEELIFMKPPPGWNIPKNKIWRVVKSLYGLKQAPRVWYEKLCSEVKNWGFRKSKYDPCVFVHDNWQIIIGIWVDDCLILAPNESTAEKVRTKFSQTFKMKDEGLCEWYLGMHVVQSSESIILHHQNHIEKTLRRFNLENAKHKSTPLTPGLTLVKKEDKQEDEDFTNTVQQKIGSLVYLAGQTRPDISFPANYIARFMSNPSIDHMEACDHILSYLRHTADKGLRYQRGDGSTNLVGFVDSDYAGCADTRRSTTGWVFMLAKAPISWSSQRQRTVALSTTDAEYVAAAEAAKEAVWIKGLINDLQLENLKVDSVPLYVDNEGARKLSRNPEFHNRTKYIDIRHHFIREKVESGDIDTRRVDTRYNTADMLTKSLGKGRLEDLLKMMGMITMTEAMDQGGDSTPEKPRKDDY